MINSTIEWFSWLAQNLYSFRYGTVLFFPVWSQGRIYGYVLLAAVWLWRCMETTKARITHFPHFLGGVFCSVFGTEVVFIPFSYCINPDKRKLSIFILKIHNRSSWSNQQFLCLTSDKISSLDNCLLSNFILFKSNGCSFDFLCCTDKYFKPLALRHILDNFFSQSVWGNHPYIEVNVGD